MLVLACTNFIYIAQARINKRFAHSIARARAFETQTTDSRPIIPFALYMRLAAGVKTFAVLILTPLGLYLLKLFPFIAGTRCVVR